VDKILVGPKMVVMTISKLSNYYILVLFSPNIFIQKRYEFSTIFITIIKWQEQT